MSRPHEQMPERCKEFMAWLHRSRAIVGSKPVTDDVAVEAFDMVWEFIAEWRANGTQADQCMTKVREHFDARRTAPETRVGCRHCGSTPLATERGRCEECGKYQTADGQEPV